MVFVSLEKVYLWGDLAAMLLWTAAGSSGIDPSLKRILIMIWGWEYEDIGDNQDDYRHSLKWLFIDDEDIHEEEHEDKYGDECEDECEDGCEDKCEDEYED